MREKIEQGKKDLISNDTTLIDNSEANLFSMLRILHFILLHFNYSHIDKNVLFMSSFFQNYWLFFQQALTAVLQYPLTLCCS